MKRWRKHSAAQRIVAHSPMFFTSISKKEFWKIYIKLLVDHCTSFKNKWMNGWLLHHGHTLSHTSLQIRNFLTRLKIPCVNRHLLIHFLNWNQIWLKKFKLLRGKSYAHCPLQIFRNVWRYYGWSDGKIVWIVKEPTLSIITLQKNSQDHCNLRFFY